MADLASTLQRASACINRFEGPGFSLNFEHSLGIAKLRVYGRDFEAHFETINGFRPPPTLRQIEEEKLTFAWLAPGEWLITGTEMTVGAWLQKVNSRGDDELIALDFTHARASFILEGPDSRTALAKHCPLNLWPDLFPVGAVARSLLGDSRIFIGRLADVGETPRFRVIVDQTMGSYAARLLAGG